MPIVQQVWQLALPEATRLLNEGGELSRSVLWAQRMAHHAPALGALEKAEIALLSVEAIRALDERLSLSRVVSALARRKAAALAVVGAVTEEALEIADLHKLCVFGLPDGTDLLDEVGPG